jgi:subtilisin family serine protease
LVGANAGTIADSTASGAVTSTGADSTVGALVGTSTGIITNSVGLGVVTGGVPSAPNLPPIPPIIPGCSDPLCGLLNILPPAAATLPGGLLNVLPPATATLPGAAFFESLPGPTQVINNLVGIGPTQLAALNPTAPPVFESVQGGIRLPPQQPALPAQGGQQQLPSGFDRRVIDIPPSTETRFVQDEVVLQIAGNVTVERLQAAVGRLGLILLASENLAITGSTLARFHITNGRSPAEIIRVLAAIQLVAVAQPNYVYTLQQQGEETAPAARGDTGPKGDPAQYILEKLKISDVHRMVRGTNIPIAVIDSEIDAAHPDLEGVIAQRFSAVGAPEKPHSHGTGMAGAIASHQRLLGTAPAARLLAVHAFSTTANADSTTFNILKGVDWSVREGARIINMSFAGPKDPSLERALKAAYEKGIVLIAAAGNAGPKSPPLFPGAYDPYVIAVTATDVDDKLFTGANRGKYISVAAPGVDILLPAAEGEYQITTGTSVAAAEVSGIVALLLERNPKLTPADIRRILTMSAKRLSAGERDDNFGSGLIDPLQALQLADPRTATTTPPRRR